MLHVADNRVLPIQHIDRTIRSDFDIYGAEIGVARFDNRLDFFAQKSGTVIFNFVLQDSLETDHIDDQVIALQRFGKMLARKDLSGTTRSHPLLKEGEVTAVLLRILNISGKGCCVVVHVTRTIGHKVLPPIIKDVAMWVSEAVAHIGVQLESSRFESIDSPVHHANCFTPGCFHLRMMKCAFLEI